MNQLRLTSCQARNTFPLMRQLAGYLSKRLGITAVYQDSEPWQMRSAQLHDGVIGLGWICSKPYALLLEEPEPPLLNVAVPVPLGQLYAGQPVYFSHLVVPREHPAKSIWDLENGRVAYNEPGSQSGHFSLHWALERIGKTAVFFGEWVESGAHRQSLRLLREAAIDAAAIDSTLWDYELHHDPRCFDHLRIIDTLGPFPAPPLVAHQSLEPELRQNLKRLLLTMHEEPEGQAILAAGLISHFAVVEDDFYRQLLPKR